MWTPGASGSTPLVSIGNQLVLRTAGFNRLEFVEGVCVGNGRPVLFCSKKRTLANQTGQEWFIDLVAHDQDDEVLRRRSVLIRWHCEAGRFESKHALYQLQCRPRHPWGQENPLLQEALDWVFDELEKAPDTEPLTALCDGLADQVSRFCYDGSHPMLTGHSGLDLDSVRSAYSIHRFVRQLTEDSVLPLVSNCADLSRGLQLLALSIGLRVHRLILTREEGGETFQAAAVHGLGWQTPGPVGDNSEDRLSFHEVCYDPAGDRVYDPSYKLKAKSGQWVQPSAMDYEDYERLIVKDGASLDTSSRCARWLHAKGPPPILKGLTQTIFTHGRAQLVQLVGTLVLSDHLFRSDPDSALLFFNRATASITNAPHSSQCESTHQVTMLQVSDDIRRYLQKLTPLPLRVTTVTNGNQTYTCYSAGGSTVLVRDDRIRSIHHRLCCRPGHGSGLMANVEVVEILNEALSAWGPHLPDVSPDGPGRPPADGRVSWHEVLRGGSQVLLGFQDRQVYAEPESGRIGVLLEYADDDALAAIGSEEEGRLHIDAVPIGILEQ